MKIQQRYAKPLMWLSALLMTAVVAGCGGGGKDPILGADVVAVVFVPPAGAVIPSACTAAGPTVTTSDPANGNQFVGTSTAGVAGGGKSIAATFSEAMNGATINSTSFTLARTGGAVLIPASVSYAANVATLNTSAALLANTSYTAVIQGAVTNSAGTTIGCNYAWSFKTAVVVAEDPPASILASAGRYGIFGGTAGMTNTGNLTVINGSNGNSADIATTATGNSSITGFHDSSPSDAYSDTNGANSGFVTGKIYTCTTSTTGPTVAAVNAASCARATQGRLDAQTAYLALAAMPVSGVAAPANLSGLTLAAGVYKAPSGSFLLDGTNLTLHGTATDVWVFQMASSLTVGGANLASSRSVILTGGALAKNVFWQVGSAAIINAAGGGTMEGTIIAQEGAAFSTAGSTVPVTLNGRALSLGASVTLVNTLINVPAP
ncbi:MAG: ice-binding family protein [bacterium]